MNDWWCPCDACNGTLEPPEPTEDEIEAWLEEREARYQRGLESLIPRSVRREIARHERWKAERARYT